MSSSSSALLLLHRLLQEEDHDDHDDHEDHEDHEDHYEDEFYSNSTDTTTDLTDVYNANKPWGDVVLASFLVVLVTFIGALLAALTPCLRKRVKAHSVLYRIVIPGFAAGALMAAAVFLIIPESLNLLAKSASMAAVSSAHRYLQQEGDDHEDHDDHEDEDHLLHHLNETEEEHAAHDADEFDDHDEHDEHTTTTAAAAAEEQPTAIHYEGEVHGVDEAQYVWKFGACILGGFLFPILLGALFPMKPASECKECENEDKIDNDGSNGNEDESEMLVDTDLNVIVGTTVVGGGTHHHQQAHQPTEVITTTAPIILERSTESVTMELECETGDCVHKEHTPLDFVSEDDDIDVDVDKEDIEEQASPAACCGGHDHHHHHHTDKKKEGNNIQGNAHKNHHHVDGDVCGDKEVTKVLNIPLATSILIGDAFHNFTDGIFLGTSFMLCSRQLAYTLMATTIYHELAQELADFILLTHHCGLPVWKALLMNLVSGLSTMVGACLILAIDLTPEATGCILAVSAGVYLYITAVETIPKILKDQDRGATQTRRESSRSMLVFFLCFTAGAVPIGLVLLNHGHCEAGGDHEGHDH